MSEMTVGEARQLAEELGYRIEKGRGRDAWVVRDLYTDVAVLGARYGLTLAEIVKWLDRERLRRQE